MNQNKTNTDLEINQVGMTEELQWNQINWKKLERRVYKLQKRIYRASSRGDVKAVRRLQKTLLHSWSAKCLAVRKVTQDNHGKKTAGVDGVKSLTPNERLELVGRLKLTGKAKPTRRVWIPKPNTDEKRPLGIPVMYDRALQALVKSALEPEWEAKFEPNSYGFRPGRSCHDAIGAIFLAIKHKAKFVLDADISKCFDRINHKTLMKKVHTFPTLSRQIKAWLKAGVLDKGTYEDTYQGTPQGGVISPLLANIALHGMENRIKQFARTFKGIKANNEQALTLVRYADDFVILHENLEVVQKCQRIITEWLNEMGLELNPEKTKIIHTLNKHMEVSAGLDFLGFNIRQYKVGKCHTGKNTKGIPLGFKTIIKPSKKKIKRHWDKMSGLIEANKTAKQENLIDILNPIIKGWANYYSGVCSKEIYSALDMLMYQKLRRWANRRHPNKGDIWVVKKYWQTIGGDHWVFATSQRIDEPKALKKHAATPIVRHVKVKGEASPYDGDIKYWSQRMGSHPEISTREAKLLKRQKGKCARCGHNFLPEDKWEIDHVIPKALGGRDSYENTQLLHKHCHDSKTREDLIEIRKVRKELPEIKKVRQTRKTLAGTNVNRPIIEEPCEGKSFKHGSEDEWVW